MKISCTFFKYGIKFFDNEKIIPNKKILETFFKYCIKFFDNEIIIKLLCYYNYKKPISDSILREQLNDEKYKISL